MTELIKNTNRDYVPVADTSNNYEEKDAVGNKTDAAVTTVGNVASLVAYTKGILNSVAALTNDQFSVAPTNPSSIDVNNNSIVGFSVVDVNNGPIASASITAGTYNLIRYRAGVSTNIVTSGAMDKMDGVIYKDITFAAANWAVDDMYALFPLGDQRVSIGGVSHYVNCPPLVGYITDLSTTDAAVDTVNTNLGAIANTPSQTSTAISSLREIQRNLGAPALLGTAEAGSNATTIVDASFIGYPTSYFVNEYIGMQSGTYTGSRRRISAFDGTSGTFTVEAFPGAIIATDTFEIFSKAANGISNIGSNYSSDRVDTSLVPTHRYGSVLSRLQEISTNLGVDLLTGLTEAGSNATTIVDATYSTMYLPDNYFNEYWVAITSGAQAGLQRQVSDFDSVTGTFTIAALPGALGIGDSFVIIPQQYYSSSLLGANNADNRLDTTLVAANADGTIVERSEYIQSVADAIQSDLGNPSARTNFKSIETMLGIPDAANSNIDDILRSGFDSSSLMPTPNGSILERMEDDYLYWHPQAGTEDGGGGSDVTVTDATYAGYGDDYFNQYSIIMTSGARAGQLRKVSNYTSIGGVFTVEAFTGNIANGDTFMLFPPFGTAMYLIGDNNLANTADTSKVTSNADGSVLEREEYIQSNMCTYVSGSYQATYSYTDAGGEQTIKEITLTDENVRIEGIWLDLATMTQNGTVKTYYKIDGTNYREVTSDSFVVATDSDGVWIDMDVGICHDFKVTYTEGADETAARNIPYTIIYENI